jgi:hypothetical protein
MSVGHLASSSINSKDLLGCEHMMFLLMIVKQQRKTALLTVRDRLRLAFLLAHLTKWHTPLHISPSALRLLVGDSQRVKPTAKELTCLVPVFISRLLSYRLCEHKQMPVIKVLSIRNSFMGEETVFRFRSHMVSIRVLCSSIYQCLNGFRVPFIYIKKYKSQSQ